MSSPDFEVPLEFQISLWDPPDPSHFRPREWVERIRFEDQLDELNRLCRNSPDVPRLYCDEWW